MFRHAASNRPEGFGLVFLEAQACGVPVVSYRTGGVPEAVADGETGLLATERDIEGLAARLHALLTNDEQWLRMIACGRGAPSRFDLARQTAALEDIYDDCRGVPRASESPRSPIAHLARRDRCSAWKAP